MKAPVVRPVNEIEPKRSTTDRLGRGAAPRSDGLSLGEGIDSRRRPKQKGSSCLSSFDGRAPVLAGRSLTSDIRRGSIDTTGPHYSRGAIDPKDCLSPRQIPQNGVRWGRSSGARRGNRDGFYGFHRSPKQARDGKRSGVCKGDSVNGPICWSDTPTDYRGQAIYREAVADFRATALSDRDSFLREGDRRQGFPRRLSRNNRPTVDSPIPCLFARPTPMHRGSIFCHCRIGSGLGPNDLAVDLCMSERRSRLQRNRTVSPAFDSAYDSGDRCRCPAVASGGDPSREAPAAVTTRLSNRLSRAKGIEGGCLSPLRPVFSFVKGYDGPRSYLSIPVAFIKGGHGFDSFHREAGSTLASPERGVTGLTYGGNGRFGGRAGDHLCFSHRLRSGTTLDRAFIAFRATNGRRLSASPVPPVSGVIFSMRFSTNGYRFLVRSKVRRVRS